MLILGGGQAAQTAQGDQASAQVGRPLSQTFSQGKMDSELKQSHTTLPAIKGGEMENMKWVDSF